MSPYTIAGKYRCVDGLIYAENRQVIVDLSYILHLAKKIGLL